MRLNILRVWVIFVLVLYLVQRDSSFMNIVYIEMCVSI